ncbi:MAG: DUF4760 domain-containing protein [Pseudomonadota bacterium]
MDLFNKLEFWQLMATLLIAYSVHRYGKQNTTMNAVKELREKSDPAYKHIEHLPKKYEELGREQRSLVAAYLNEYEHFCALYNTGIINRSLAKITRQDTIVKAYEEYCGFIESWRKEHAPEAWEQLRICAEELGAEC